MYFSYFLVLSIMHAKQDLAVLLTTQWIGRDMSGKNV